MCSRILLYALAISLPLATTRVRFPQDLARAGNLDEEPFGCKP